MVMGIKPLRPGFDGIRVKPHMYAFGSMNLIISTPKGAVKAERKVEQGKVSYRVELPEKMDVLFCFEDGKETSCYAKHIGFEYEISTVPMQGDG